MSYTIFRPSDQEERDWEGYQVLLFFIHASMSRGQRRHGHHGRRESNGVRELRHRQRADPATRTSTSGTDGRPNRDISATHSVTGCSQKREQSRATAAVSRFWKPKLPRYWSGHETQQPFSAPKLSASVPDLTVPALVYGKYSSTNTVRQLPSHRATDFCVTGGRPGPPGRGAAAASRTGWVSATSASCWPTSASTEPHPTASLGKPSPQRNHPDGGRKRGEGEETEMEAVFYI